MGKRKEKKRKHAIHCFSLDWYCDQIWRMFFHITYVFSFSTWHVVAMDLTFSRWIWEKICPRVALCSILGSSMVFIWSNEESFSTRFQMTAPSMLATGRTTEQLLVNWQLNIETHNFGKWKQGSVRNCCNRVWNTILLQMIVTYNGTWKTPFLFFLSYISLLNRGRSLSTRCPKMAFLGP